jgi:signal transduction histidine kinase
VAWVLVVVLVVAVGVLLFRKPENPYAGALDRLTRDLERGTGLASEVAGEPPEVGRLRGALAESWQPIPSRADGGEEPGDRAIRGLVRYLREAALNPLRSSLDGGGDLATTARNVVDALEDLEFYAQEPLAEESVRTNLATLVQEVAREYTRGTEIPVKLRFASPTLPARVHPETFKDALFLLLANAGRFGKGDTVVIEAEGSEEGVRVRILDRGPGFSPEALERAFEPFWTTDPDAVGMGLTYARRILEGRGMRLRVGNREEGGGEAVVLVSSG